MSGDYTNGSLGYRSHGECSTGNLVKTKPKSFLPVNEQIWFGNHGDLIDEGPYDAIFIKPLFKVELLFSCKIKGYFFKAASGLFGKMIPRSVCTCTVEHTFYPWLPYCFINIIINCICAVKTVHNLKYLGERGWIILAKKES